MEESVFFDLIIISWIYLLRHVDAINTSWDLYKVVPNMDRGILIITRLWTGNESINSLMQALHMHMSSQIDGYIIWREKNLFSHSHL